MSASIKKTGKIFVIVLLCAVLFFVLLPFLDEADPQTAANGSKSKKAIPQIFTSNPLTKLANKLYNMLHKDKVRMEPQPIAWMMPNGQVVRLSTEQAQRYADDNIGRAALAGYTNLPVGESYFIDQDGEWFLVKQTAPNALKLGMHDINSSDNAYERFIRQERAAKWTAQSAQQIAQIPDSKWARLWRPIQKLFGGKDSHQTVSRDVSADPEASWQLSATHDMPGQNRYMDTAYSRAGLDMPGFGAAMASSMGYSDSPIASVFDIEGNLEYTADRLKQTAKSLLPADKAEKAGKNIDKKRLEGFYKAVEQLNAKLNEEASNEQAEEYIKDTLSCGGSKSVSLYGGSDECSTHSEKTSPEEVKAAHSSSLKDIYEVLHTKFPSVAVKDFEVLPLLGKTTPGKQLNDSLIPSSQEEETRTITAKQLHDYVYKYAGCDKHDCYWVGSDAETHKDRSLYNIIQSSGARYFGDKSDLLTRAMDQFLQDKLRDVPESDREERADALRSQVREALPYYVPKTKEQMEELLNQAYPKKGEGKKFERADHFFITFVPSAANTKQLQDDGFFQNGKIAFVVYGDGTQLSAQNPASDIDKGRSITNLLTDHVHLLLDNQEETQRDMVQGAAQDITKGSIEKVDKQIKQDKDGGWSGLESQTRPKKNNNTARQ